MNYEYHNSYIISSETIIYILINISIFLDYTL